MTKMRNEILSGLCATRSDERVHITLPAEGEPLLTLCGHQAHGLGDRRDLHELIGGAPREVGERLCTRCLLVAERSVHWSTPEVDLSGPVPRMV